ncbi:MAG: RNA-binding protein [Pseudomonadota bacterium]
MSRGGQSKSDTGSERRCIATGETHPKGGLIRFVVDPDLRIVPDLLEKLPGRGIWVSPARPALELAQSKGHFSRAARQKVLVAEDLADQIEDGLVRRFSDLLAMSRKAGEAVAGFEKVKDWLGKDYAEVLVQASDGSPRERKRLSTPYEGRFIGCMTADELGRAFGRDRVIHAALAPGGLTTRVVETAAKLEAVRGWTGVPADRKGKSSE